LKTEKIELKKILAVSAACSFFVGLDSIITVPLLPTIAKSASIPMNLGALLVSVYALVYMISAPIFGAISDKAGRKRMIFIGMLVLGLGTLLTGFGQDFASLLCFRAITGLGAAMLEPSIFALIGDKFPYEQRGRAVGTVMGALIGSTLFGVPLGAYFTQIVSWRWTFWGIGLLALFMLLAIFLCLPKEQPKKNIPDSSVPSVMQPFRIAFSNMSVLLALVATLLWFGGLQGMFANIGFYYNHYFQLTVSQIGFILMAAGFGSVIGNIVGGKLADKVGKKVVVGCASVFTAAGVLGVSLISENLILAIVVHVLWSTAFGFGHAALTAFISELSPSVRGTVLSLNSSAMYAGMMGATAISATMLYQSTFTAIGIFCALSTLLVLPITIVLKSKTTPTDSSESLKAHL